MALIAIVALLGGVPFALWTWGGGAPWPSSAPSGGWLSESLGAEQILGILVAVLWLAWAHFAICVIVEFVQGRRDAHRVPGGGALGIQSLARRLVASTMLLIGSAAVVTPAATAATGPNVEHSAVAGTTGSGADSTHASNHAAKQGQTVKQKASKPTELRPGLAIRTPQGVKYEVQPPHNRQYDCLWDIAERYLNDGMRWKEIYHLNKDLEQPDGNSLQDPDLIYPGWILQLPDDAKGPGIITIGAADDTKQMQHHTDHEQGNRGTEHNNGGDDDANQEVLVRGDEKQRASGRDSDDDMSTWAAPLGVGGGLVAASLLLALRRRRGWQGRPGGGGGLKPGDEANLRLAADGPAALLVDRSMRQLAHATYQGGQSVPPVRAAYLNEQSLTLAFEAPAVMPIPDGWRSSPDGRMWMVDRAVAETFDPPSGVASPCPTLTTLGTTGDGTLVMVNLASARGLVALTGGVPAYEAALSMAVELATAPWTDTLPVTLVGFADNLTDLAPDRVRQVNAIDAVLSAPSGIVLLARQATPEQEQQFAAAIAQGRVAAVIAVGQAAGATWRFDLTPEGRLVNAPLGLDLAAQRIPTAAVARMVELFRWADAGRPAAQARVTPQPVPGFDPAMLQRGAKPPVSVQLLGPVQVEAPGEIEADRQALATEIVAYLALNPGGVHPTVLASAIWPRGVSDEVFEASIARVQSWLGRRADGGERLLQDEQQRWRLDLRDVRVDWHVLRAFVARAERSEDPTMDLASALSCVEGPALDALPAHRYSWLANTTAVRDIQTTVVGVALRVSSVAADAGNVGLAHESLRTGLDMVPGCEELWRAELRITHRFDGTEAVHRVADEMFVAIERHGSPRGAEPTTTALVEELLPGYGRVLAGKIA
jgi:LysM domain